LMEFNSFGPAVGRLGSDSSRGGANSAKVEAGGLSPPPSPPHFNHCSQGDWGWEKCDGEWGVVWPTLPEAAKACYELLSCKRKKTCRGNCKCYRANCSALHCALAMDSIMETELTARPNTNSGRQFMPNYMYRGRLSCIQILQLHV